ncbi:MAG: VOC family protein [Granulosicoccus sp.]
MQQRIALSTIVVHDYDDAINFFVDVLGFTLIEDTKLDNDGKRWVVVAPAKSTGSSLLLAKADGEQQLKAIGNQTGGRVAFFLYTDNCLRDFEYYKSKGVVFVREPITEEYGTVAVFEDISGNLWDLIGPS